MLGCVPMVVWSRSCGVALREVGAVLLQAHERAGARSRGTGVGRCAWLPVKVAVVLAGGVRCRGQECPRSCVAGCV